MKGGGGWTKFDSRLDDTWERYCWGKIEEERERGREIYRLNRVFASGSVCHKFGGKLKSLVTIDETGRMEWKMKK